MSKGVTRKILRGFLIGIGIFVFLNIFFSFNLFSSWQDKLTDSLFVPRPPHPDIVIIAIDDKSISEIGRFPWKRSIYAQLLHKLNPPAGGLNSKPKSVGLDVSFLESSDESEDNALSQALADLKTVTISGEEKDNGMFALPIDKFARNANVGIANTTSDSFATTRFARLTSKSVKGETYYGFSYQVAKNYLGKTEHLDSIANKYRDLRINFIGPPNSFKTYSFTDVLKGNVDPKIFGGKIVLIGATAPDLHDSQFTPTSDIDPMNGVEIQANAIQTILDGKFINEESRLATLLGFLVVSVASSIVFTLLPITGVIIAFFVLLAILIFWIFLSFDRGIIRNLIYPALALVLASIANIIYKYISETRKREFLRKVFSYYLSEPVLNELLANPTKIKLGGERKKLTVLFSDIAGFTTIAEKIPPETLLALLNQYLTTMTEIVFKHRGVLDKYIGDGIMAFWGAPIKETNHALCACYAALEMYQRATDIKNFWMKKGIDFDVRIGVNSGDMIVGNMGSSQRFDYTVVGDNVNLGSRLESINKEYGTHIIISQDTHEQVKDEIVARKLDVVAVKGRERGVAIYELIGLKNRTANEGFLRDFEEARALYEAGSFPESMRKFKILSKKYPSDQPTAVYLSRLRKLTKLDVRPKKWDGVYHPENK